MSHTSRAAKENTVPIKLIATDWSGVISDDRLPVYEACMRVLENHGKDRFSFQEWLPRTRLTAIEFLADHGVMGDSKLLFDEFKDNYSKVRVEGTNPVAYPDSKEVLKFLTGTGTPVVVISSHPEEHLMKEALEYGVLEYVMKFVGSVKDKSEGLLQVCLEMRRDPSGLVYLGDTIYDIQAAKKAGIRSIGVATGYHIKSRLENEEPYYVASSLTDFKNKFESLLRT